MKRVFDNAKCIAEKLFPVLIGMLDIGRNYII